MTMDPLRSLLASKNGVSEGNQRGSCPARAPADADDMVAQSLLKQRGDGASGQFHPANGHRESASSPNKQVVAGTKCSVTVLPLTRDDKDADDMVTRTMSQKENGDSAASYQPHKGSVLNKPAQSAHEATGRNAAVAIDSAKDPSEGLSVRGRASYTRSETAEDKTMDVVGDFTFPLSGSLSPDRSLSPPDRELPARGRSQREQHAGRRWHCALCRAPTIPVMGALARPLSVGQGARHHCRYCGRTVCGGCSLIINRVRTCNGCNLKESITVLPGPHQEKFIFFVRHARSIWNEAMSSGARDIAALSRDVDHSLSDTGRKQTTSLRNRVAAGFDEWGGSSGSSWYSMDSAKHVQEYYSTFYAHRDLIYCSPLLRALETAHLSFPSEDGWGKIQLLRDAREHYRFVTERDCIGTAVGDGIAERAVRLGQGLRGLGRRVDSSDCDDEWWSRLPETGPEFERRHNSLWDKLLEYDPNDACVLVTHSNLIRSMLARFGAAESNCDSCGQRRGQRCERTLCRGRAAKLENCGVLGVRCVLAGVENHTHERRQAWVAKDALLMFGSKFDG